MKKFSKIALIIILVIIIIGLILCFYIKENNSNNLINNNTDDTYIVDSQSSSSNNSVYSIKYKSFYLIEGSYIDEEYRGMKLLEYDNSANDYAEIYYIFYDYETDPTFYYSLEITDENNSSLILNSNEEKIIGGTVSSVKIKKIDLDKTINISIFEKYAETGDISESSETQINLLDDLEEKVKINQNENLKSGKLGDINFEYIDSEYVYFGTTSHAYSENLIGEYSSIPIKTQYGNYLISEEHFEFSYDKNVNNLTLEEAFNDLTLITKTVGQYGLSDVYGMDIADENSDITDTVIINYNDMINLCNGQTITKNGIEYTKNSFDTYAGLSMVKDDEVKLGNGIAAIKYHYENDDGETSEEADFYMFIYNDNIYKIKVPTNIRLTSDVQNFLDSLEIK